MTRLENWCMTTRQDNPYQAPETQLAIAGNVYGHPDWPDGTPITTSVIASVDKETSSVITRSGSIYVLGEVDPAVRETISERSSTPF